MPLAPAASTTTVGLVSILALGFVLGMRHATDADHVVAVSTIVARERRIRSAAYIGALWGFGHTLTLCAVGIGLIGFALVVPPRVGLSMEFSVGLMLVLLGWINLRGASRSWRTTPSLDPAFTAHTEAAPQHDAGVPHTHTQGDNVVERLDQHFGAWTAHPWVRPLIVGLVHGLAGSAAVALLVLATIHDTKWALAYLFLFGVGTIAGMMVITIAMATALQAAGARSRWINQRLGLATGILSVAFGLFIVYQMGFAHGLFTSHPTWTPE